MLDCVDADFVGEVVLDDEVLAGHGLYSPSPAVRCVAIIQVWPNVCASDALEHEALLERGMRLPRES